MTFDYLHLIQTEPEPLAALPDYSAEIEERHRLLALSRDPPGMGCGCKLCREPVE